MKKNLMTLKTKIKQWNEILSDIHPANRDWLKDYLYIIGDKLYLSNTKEENQIFDEDEIQMCQYIFKDMYLFKNWNKQTGATMFNITQFIKRYKIILKQYEDKD
jgi:hypothetical protein